MAGWSGAQRASKPISGTWTYDPSSVADLHVIRFTIGDTDTNDRLMSNEEIQRAITLEPNRNAAAAWCCESLAAYFDREADKTVGDTTEHLAVRAKAYREQARALRSRSATLAAPWAGGISIADRDSRNADTDRIEPGFTISQFDNEESLP